jgi:tripartite ATP-independent transporter DctP family solute receptor
MRPTRPATADRRHLLRVGGAAALATALPTVGGLAVAQSRQALRVSTPAVPDDWHAKMWTVFREALEKSAPGAFDVQIHLAGSLFKQGAEPVAMARGNLELAAVSAADIAKQVPAFSVFTAGYVIRDPQHQQKVFDGPIGRELFGEVEKKMDIVPLATLYLGTRQLALREPRAVRVPADLKGLKLRMPGSKEWLFLGEALGATATPLAFGEVYLALKTGTIDGQDNPLPTVRAAKFHEVTKQLVLTSHLVDGLFVAVSSRAWAAMDAARRQQVRSAAQAAVAYNNENRLKEEAELVAFFRQQGLQVTTPDVDAFRRAVAAAYASSDIGRGWPPGLAERIAAVR